MPENGDAKTLSYVKAEIWTLKNANNVNEKRG